MNATAHDSAHESLDGITDLWPEDLAEDVEDTLKIGVRQRAVLFSATAVALAGLFTAIVLQTAYHAVILLWVSLGLPLLFAAKTIAHIGRAALDRIRGWSCPAHGVLAVRDRSTVPSAARRWLTSER
jgi:hypothetical protein